MNHGHKSLPKLFDGKFKIKMYKQILQRYFLKGRLKETIFFRKFLLNKQTCKGKTSFVSLEKKVFEK